MRLTKEEARAYKGYVLTPKQLIEKAKKFYDDLTPEERDEEYIVYGNNIKFEKVEVERLTTGEFYMRCVNDIEKRYEEFKNLRGRPFNYDEISSIEGKGKEYIDRLEYELGIIKQMGYVDYFLIVWDFIHYAKTHNIPVGPGRGSRSWFNYSICN